LFGNVILTRSGKGKKLAVWLIVFLESDKFLPLYSSHMKYDILCFSFTEAWVFAWDVLPLPICYCHSACHKPLFSEDILIMSASCCGLSAEL
jgi:hypothetical protein